MRTWYTFGAFGDCVYELSWFDWIGLLFGRELARNCTVISLGKSKIKSMYNAPSRETQLHGR